MKHSAISFLLVVLTATLVMGCLDLGPDFGGGNGSTFDWDEPAPTSSDLDVRESSLTGTIGAITNLDDAANDIDSYISADWASITSYVDQVDGSAMTIVDIYGGLDHADLQPGTTLRFDAFGSDDATSDLMFSVVGCAGPERGAWDYDEPAEEVVVDVEEDPDYPGALALTYTARFPVRNYDYWEDGLDSVDEYTSVTGRLVVNRE